MQALNDQLHTNCRRMRGTKTRGKSSPQRLAAHGEHRIARLRDVVQFTAKRKSVSPCIANCAWQEHVVSTLKWRTRNRQRTCAQSCSPRPDSTITHDTGSRTQLPHQLNSILQAIITVPGCAHLRRHAWRAIQRSGQHRTTLFMQSSAQARPQTSMKYVQSIAKLARIDAAGVANH